MRIIIALMVGVLCQVSLSAQVKKELNASGVKTIHLIVDQSDVMIEGVSGNQVMIETAELKPIPERAKGLRPLHNNATDNTGAGMEMTKDGSTMVLKKARGGSSNYKIKVPAGVNLKVEESSWMGGDFELSNVSGEIEIDTKNGNIVMKKVSGPITASSTSGDIEVVFSSLNQTKPTTISNISGFIDVTLSGGTKANLRLNNITGEVYSNYELTKPKDGMKVYGGRKISKELNGGGVEVSLKNISGDIYLRK